MSVSQFLVAHGALTILAFAFVGIDGLRRGFKARFGGRAG